MKILISFFIFFIGSLAMASDLCQKEARYAAVAVVQSQSAVDAEADSFEVSPNGGYYANKLSSDTVRAEGSLNSPTSEIKNIVYAVHAQVSQGPSLIATVILKANVIGEDFSCSVISVQPAM